MARLITSNMIVAPTGMNKQYWDDYVESASHSGDFLKGIGEIGQSLEDAGLDYMAYREKQADKEAAAQRQAREDERQAKLDKQNDTRFQNEQTSFGQQQADYAERVKAKAARQQQIEKFYEGEHDPIYDTLEGQTAAQSYIDGNLDALNGFRDRMNNAALLKKQNEEAAALKDAEDGQKETEDSLSAYYQSLNLGMMTDKDFQDMSTEVRKQYLQKLKNLKAAAVKNHSDNLARDIDTVVEKLRMGDEKQTAETKAKGKKAESDAQDKADAALFGGKRK